jgi:single-strand DNA-binding protein
MLLGNLGADPELRAFGGGGPDQTLLKIRLATTESYFDKKQNEWKDRTDWHNIVIFGRRAEALHKLLSKGSKIFVEGHLQTSSYEKNGQKVWSTSVVASNVVLCGNPMRSHEPSRTQTSSASEASAIQDDFDHDDDGDIPF